MQPSPSTSPASRAARLARAKMPTPLPSRWCDPAAAGSNLIGLFVAETFFRSQILLSAEDVRTRVSYDLAALIVSTPLWLGLWRVAGRGIRRSEEERQAPERRLYLALAFAVTSIVS